MARIRLSSYLQSVSGRLGNIVYYNTNGKEYARVYTIPGNPDTEGQRAVRRTFGDAVKSWQMLPEDKKQNYNMKARRLPISGYNLYISLYMKENIPLSRTKQKNSSLSIAVTLHPARSGRADSSVLHPLQIQDSSHYPFIRHIDASGKG